MIATLAVGVLVATSPIEIACTALNAPERVEEALRSLPEEPQNRPLRGVAWLLAGRRLAAAKELRSEPSFAAYLAMAQKNGPGGMGRARQTLAASVDREDADTLFLAALAFWSAGQKAKADTLLARALAAAPDALAPSFAPDAANGLVAAVRKAGGDVAALVPCLVESGRMNLALRAAGDDDVRALEVWAGIDDTEALRFGQRLLKADEGDSKARAAVLGILVRQGKFDRVRRLLAADIDDDPAVLRARARIAILDEDQRAAIDAASAAAKADPKSDAAVALMVEALLVNEEADRAAAFAAELLRRRPIDVDPFALLVRVDRARGRSRHVRANELRSRAFLEDWNKRRVAVERREKIFRAVRTAEATKSATGLAAMTADDVALSLPVDLALARWGEKGTARAARDRILDACGPHLARFLERTTPWERLARTTNVYTKPRDATLLLSAADPARCARGAPMKARRKKRR